MKITGVKVYPIDLWRSLEKGIIQREKISNGPMQFIFIKLTTDEGISGWGETSELPFGIVNSAVLFKEIVEQDLAGMSPFDMEKAFRKVYGRYFSGRPEKTLLGIMSAIDMACWDIIGKAANQPVYNLLGGMYNKSIRTYSYLFSDKQDPARWREDIIKYMEMGFTAIKFDPIPGCNNPRMLSLEELRFFDNIMKITKEVTGDKCDILVGTHGQFTTGEAIRLAKVLEPYKPLWFEEPVAPDNIEEMAYVARSTSIPIASGERLATKYEFYQLISKHAISIAQLDMGRVGGMLEAKKVAGIAEACYMQIAPHVYSGPILASASIQLDVCSPNFLIQEGIYDWGKFQADILKEPIKWEKGYVIPSDKPGLGVEVNEEYAKKLTEDY